jgi:Crinkler effector protein N-terminal domain
MLGTPVPSQDGSYKLICLIEGETIIFTAGRDWVVGKLKKKIKKERGLGTLKDVDPQTLELWKVSARDVK